MKRFNIQGRRLDNGDWEPAYEKSAIGSKDRKTGSKLTDVPRDSRPMQHNPPGSLRQSRQKMRMELDIGTGLG